jgi:hypothetical protein
VKIVALTGTPIGLVVLSEDGTLWHGWMTPPSIETGTTIYWSKLKGPYDAPQVQG